MKYSLLQVKKEEGQIVTGTWIQDHIGTIETARQAARDTENANGGHIKVAVVLEVLGKYDTYSMIRLD